MKTSPPISVTGTTQRSALEAFALVADRVNAAVWDPRVLEVTELEGEPGTSGYRFRERRRAGGTSTGTVVEVEPDRVFSVQWKLSGEESMLVERWEFTPTRGGTRVRLSVGAVLTEALAASFAARSIIRIGMMLTTRPRLRQQLEVMLAFLEGERGD